MICFFLNFIKVLLLCLLNEIKTQFNSFLKFCKINRQFSKLKAYFFIKCRVNEKFDLLNLHSTYFPIIFVRTKNPKPVNWSITFQTNNKQQQIFVFIARCQCKISKISKIMSISGYFDFRMRASSNRHLTIRNYWWTIGTKIIKSLNLRHIENIRSSCALDQNRKIFHL